MRRFIGLGLLILGCQALPPAQQATFDLFACRVDALEPYTGAVYDTAQLVRQAVLGKTDLVRVLLGMGYTQAQVIEAVEAWNACEQPVVAPVTATGLTQS